MWSGVVDYLIYLFSERTREIQVLSDMAPVGIIR